LLILNLNLNFSVVLFFDVRFWKAIGHSLRSLLLSTFLIKERSLSKLALVKQQLAISAHLWLRKQNKMYTCTILLLLKPNLHTRSEALAGLKQRNAVKRQILQASLPFLLRKNRNGFPSSNSQSVYFT
jgi:hypothetical protein